MERRKGERRKELDNGKKIGKGSKEKSKDGFKIGSGEEGKRGGKKARSDFERKMGRKKIDDGK